jgi:hypothetical protein
MVGVAVSNDRFFHRLPGVHVEVAVGAIGPKWCHFNKIMALHNPPFLTVKSYVFIS